MKILNETVKHIMYGLGVITEEKEDKIWIQFQDDNQTKIFLYPEAFEKYIEAENPEVQNNVLEELRRKQELLRQEMESKAAKLEEKIERSISRTKKLTRTTKKKA